MDNKTVIGGDFSAAAVKKADAERQRADYSMRELTSTRKRIRTFYRAIDAVNFPVDAPEWATDWLNWLLTGDVPTPPASELEDEEPAETTA